MMRNRMQIMVEKVSRLIAEDWETIREFAARNGMGWQGLTTVFSRAVDLGLIEMKYVGADLKPVYRKRTQCTTGLRVYKLHPSATASTGERTR